MERSEGPSLPTQPAPIATPVAAPAAAPTMMQAGLEPAAVQSQPAPVAAPTTAPAAAPTMQAEAKPEKPVAMVAPGSGCATVKWTDDAIDRLEIAMQAADTGGQGIDWDQVSKQVGRTPSAYSTRALRQGLKPGAKQSDSRGLTPSDLSPAKEIRFGGARPEAALDSMYSK